MKLTLKLKISLIVIGILFHFSNPIFSQCNCDFTIPTGSGTYTFDGAIQGAKPGNTICLQAGVRERIVFKNLTGSPTNYITIVNCGGQTLLGGPNANNAITINRSRYFRITGSGDENFEYGIKITETRAGSQGIQAYDKSSDMTFDHLEITKVGFAGIMAKTDPSKTCSKVEFERPHFTLFNVEIFHNYVHDITGEGFYIGNSFFTGNTVYCGSMQYPHEVRGVRIYDNVLVNTGWEAIQVGAAVDDCEIYNNRIYDYGSANIAQQNGGIQIGIGTAARVYNNFIKGGTGIAILVQGIGNDYVYNNLIINSGTYAILMSLRPTPLETDIVPKNFVGPVGIINNTIINPSLNDAVVKESVVGPLGNVMYNNLIVGGQSNWLKLRTDTDWKTGNNIYIPNIADAKFTNPALDDYRLLPGSPAINTGRDVAEFGVTFDFDNKSRPAGSQWDVGAFELAGNQKPQVSVGENQTINLPTNNTTLSGGATDPDGSIQSYLWSKQSGPSATLVNETTTTLTVSDLQAGSYTFRLTATDNEGETGFAEVTITVIDPNINQPPAANAGGNKTITLPTNTTVLNGIGNDPDGTVITYAWTKVSGPDATLTNETTPDLTISDLTEGTYVFRLTVTDDDDDTDSDDATVTVNPVAANQPPTANAGPDRSLILPTNSINLTGSGSDPDGSIATYLWTKQSGPAATLTNANTPTLQLTGLMQGSYVFRLMVTDNNGATHFDEATVTVSAANQAPVANAGGNKTIQLPTNSTTLNGSGSDSDGTITAYLWTKVSGPTATMTNTTSTTLTLTNLLEGTYVFRLRVTDNNGATGTNDATVTVQAANAPPVADAGSPQTLILPNNSTTFNGSGTDSDGSITAYLWEKLSGPAVTLTGTTTPTLSLSNLIEGTYTFRLTVTDNNGATGSSQVTLTVLPATVNQSPIVNAGANITLTLPTNTVDITGTASDPDGTINSFLWEKLSGPDATLNGTTTATLSLTNLVEGSYIFRFTVTDNAGASASDDVTVTVTSINQSPIVSAGSNQLIVLPISSTTLTATASDPDGTIASYLWVLTAGPNTPTLAGATTNTLSVSGMIAGTYIFRITVTDNDGATASSLVNVVVQSNSNISPIANAGFNATLFLPTNSTNLNGSGSDADGTIASFQWTQISGVAATLTNASSPTLTISNLVEEVYVFRLTVTDNAGATGIDDVTVTVLPASANQPPVANAGPDIALTLPINSTNLIGSGSDADGPIVSYVWSKLSGPAATLSNLSTPVLSVQEMVEGVYFFRLTVTDNAGATASDEVQVTVFPPSVNQPPIVTAGNNKIITLPTSTTTLTALASDADGTITSYTWTKQLGPTVTLSGASSSILTLTQLIEGVYVFRITVEDNSGASSFAEVTITVQAAGTNQPPVVNAGIDKTLFLPTTSTNLNGAASDADGTVVSYLWTKTAGPDATLTNSSAPNLTVSNLEAGQYVFRLTAIDNAGATGFDEANITVFPGTVNQSPIANAGSNQTIVLSTTTANLNGSGFDPDGSIVAYAWTQITGTSTILNNINTPTLFVSNLSEGIFQYQLTVTDNNGATGSSVATITVVPEGANQPPIANAGFDQTITLPQNNIEIQGSGFDSDGNITAYNWIKKSGPAVGTLSGQTQSRLTVTNMVAGTYVFTLMVTDNGGRSNSDDVRVIVQPATVNNNPTVNAGSDIFIRLPVSSTTITANASDVDGAIASYLWTKQSGPIATLTEEATPTLSVTNLLEGTYIFRVLVVDNLGASASDEVTVVVAPPGVNKPPTVLAGSAKTILLPTNTTLLTGSASDIDGSISNIIWTQQNGPALATLSGINTVTLSIQDLIEGMYTFRLTATDNENATSSSETTINVLANHELPQVFAGNDTTLILPDNFITITGTAIPFKGFIAEFVWTQVDGSDLILTEDFPSVSLSDLLPGTYIIRLTATDNFGASNTDDIVLTVKEGKSNPIGAAIVFSPNGDSVNDFWTVKNLNMIDGCPVTIFNNLGLSVYKSDQYQNDWNGVSQNGQQLIEGDYYFVFECANKKNYSGAFRLVR